MHSRLHPCASQLCNLMQPMAPIASLRLITAAPAAAPPAPALLLPRASPAPAALCGHHLGRARQRGCTSASAHAARHGAAPPRRPLCHPGRCGVGGVVFKCDQMQCTELRDRLPPWLQLMYLPRPCACPHPPRLQVARTAPRWFQSRGGRWTHLSCQTRQPCPCRCTAAVALDCRSVSFLRCPDEGTAAHSCVSRALTPCARRACPSSALPSAPCSWPTSTLMGTPTS